MVATNYAVMAADLILEGASGRMVAVRSGTYTNVPIDVTREGVKRVDVDEFYDARSTDPRSATSPGSRCSSIDGVVKQRSSNRCRPSVALPDKFGGRLARSRNARCLAALSR